ncbi:Bacterioferritin-associated ferredoxin [Nitrosomonas marina]|uniref:Bacterioferritin-associated ferredoxin n=1 Tax=Nitrosomonas marina TaxID=917 RepID=A0A1I0AVE2_9PROT|nr:bacterioferritin-associated ferredoxin [Nitrosomonas marina]SES97528.1 Bacterioferritin-associated ferredoxin [Nitrosomonas marina]
MYICVCKGVTDGAIREAVNKGAERMRDLKNCLGVTEQCGVCACHAKEVLEQARQQKAQVQASVPETVYKPGFIYMKQLPEETNDERECRNHSVAESPITA